MTVNQAPYLAAALGACVLAGSGTLSKAQSWTMTTAPITNWASIAMSADGTSLIAAAGGYSEGGGIFRSTNSGANWFPVDLPDSSWATVASSANGSVLLAANLTGPYPFYISTDSGTTWSNTSLALKYGDSSFNAVTCTSDGKALLAGTAFMAGYSYGSQIFVSTNSGRTWTSNDFGGFLTSLACSGSFGVMAATANYAAVPSVFVSTNSGQSWFFGSGGASDACSADGTSLLSGGTGYPPNVSPASAFYKSLDSGRNWLSVTNSGVHGSCFALSANGSKMFAGAGYNAGGPIFTSRDFGAVWTQADAPSTNWQAIATSADGNVAAGVVNGGGIYISRTNPGPDLSLARYGTDVTLSWVLPSSTFVLQTNSNFSSSGWAELPANPVLNYSNLKYSVTLPIMSNSMFFRLSSK